jgi:hypothetical protein
VVRVRVRVRVRLGADDAPDADPMNPKDVLAPAASEPLQSTFVAVTLDPLDVTVAPQNWVTDWPVGKVQATFQDEIGAEPAVTLTSP